ncbi:MAG: hypothetical protein LC797_25080 [Chloroflexi bacterium]|nr:hypothetical protein [Chloroflexota bacterium]
MLGLHQLIAQALMLYYAVVGLWGVILGIRKNEMSSAYRGALTIGVVTAVVQAGVGVALLVSGRQPGSDLHFLYGVTVILTLPLVASYIANKKFSRVLAFGLASLFMAGLAYRAMTTGQL